MVFDAFGPFPPVPPPPGPFSPVPGLTGFLSPGGAQPVDDELSSESVHPVQNKVVYAALANKVDKVDGKGLSKNDFTDAYKSKLDGIAAGATAVTVDSALSNSSTNPVQNKIINSALAGKVDKVQGKGLSSNDYSDADYNKLANIAAGAEVNAVTDVQIAGTSILSSKVANIPDATTSVKGVTVVNSSITQGSTNPVQGGAIYTALGGKVDKVDGKGLSTNDFTDAYKSAVDGIHSIPSGGSSGYVLKKASGTDYDVEWAAESGGGGGSVNDVTVAGSSVVSDGTAVIPKAGSSWGVVKVSTLGEPPNLRLKVEGDGIDVSVPRLNSSTLIPINLLPLATNSARGAVVVDNALSNSSENPVQNKVIYSALGDKADSSSVHSVPSGGTSGQVLAKASGTSYDVEWVTPSGGGGDVSDVQINGTSILSSGVANIPLGGTSVAGVVQVDASLNGVSTNPVQNQVVAAELLKKLDMFGGVAFEANQDLDGIINGVYSSQTWNVIKTLSHLPVTPALSQNYKGVNLWSFGDLDNLVQVCWIAKQDVLTHAETDEWYIRYSTAHTGSSSSLPIVPTWSSWERVANASEIPTTAADVGAIAAPSTPASGDVLTYDGTSWTAAAPSGGGGVTETTVSTAGAVTQALDAGKLYHFTGAITSLTITLNAAGSGQLAQYHFDFNSGSTAATLSLPQTVVMPSGFSVAANTHYEIDVLNNYGAVMSWAISS